MTNQFKKVDNYKVSVKRSKKTYFTEANGMEYRQQYMMLKMLAISVFKWEGLPDSIDEMYLERSLFENGRILFFEDTNMSIDGVSTTFLALRFNPNSQLDIYNNPLSRIAYANNGYTESRTNKDSIICYDNLLKMPLESVIQTYAKRLADVERIIDVNLMNTKNPFILVTDEKNKEIAEKIMSDIYSNKPLILVDEEIAVTFRTKSETLSVNAPFVVDKLMDYKNTLRNEILTIIGIGNSSQDKRERLLSGEMENVNMLNTAYSTARLRARRQAIEKLKIMFPGIFDEVTVDFNTDENSQVFDVGNEVSKKEDKKEDEKGGEE